MTTLYNFDRTTKEYLIGCDTEANINPKYSAETHDIADKYMYNREASSLLPPLECSGFEVCVLENNELSIRPDHRSVLYYDTSTKLQKKIIEIGVEPDDTYTEQVPLCPAYCSWNEETKEFEIDFSTPKDEKKIDLSTFCGNAIVLTPITSDTLGTIHTYDCREVDQANAGTAHAIASAKEISKNIVCNDGVSYEPRAHTALQIIDVLDAMNTHIDTQKATLVIKKGEVDAIDRSNYDSDMECIEAIQAITW